MTSTANALEPMLRKLRLWAQLDPHDEQELLALPHTVTTIEQSNHIVSEGDAVDQCCVLLSGLCIRSKIVGDGGRQILSVHMTGDLLDLHNALLGEADHGVETITTCEVARIPVDAIRTLTNSHPAIKDAF
jgi:CRP-like cAMP-binding protein